jgi:hypothetical protein
MNIFNKAKRKLFAKNDLDIVVDYIKAALKSQLDSARIELNKGVVIDQRGDWMLRETSALVESVIKNINTVKKRTEQIKKGALDKKGPGSALSADEIYYIEMGSIKDIKREGLARALTAEERDKLKEAAKRFAIVYAEQIKSFKAREKHNRR